jgi:hypothetical protein
MEREYPGVAYKEWAPMVARLGQGEQVLLLRKGGIAEGPGGFRPEYDWFWLYATRFHPEPRKLKPEVDAEAEVDAGLVWAARVEEAQWVEDEDRVRALDALHGWAAEEIMRRFHFGRRKGLFALVVRVWRAAAEVPAPPSEAAGGCRSWIAVPPSPGLGRWRAVLGEEEFAARLGAVRAALGLS